MGNQRPLANRTNPSNSWRNCGRNSLTPTMAKSPKPVSHRGLFWCVKPKQSNRKSTNPSVLLNRMALQKVSLLHHRKPMSQNPLHKPFKIFDESSKDVKPTKSKTETLPSIASSSQLSPCSYYTSIP
uniref:ADP-ribosylation factor-like protein 2 n=1 Tax=Phallusia mammillata TaxID=59560 RepID=A0A6F9D6K4_9ASCI|nr:ADP-ribosylation factor-like protein 2 [Phallusia mammillata]